MSADLTVAELGVPEVQSSDLPPEHALRVASALDKTWSPADAQRLPLLWHWAFFTPTAPHSALGEDGHPSLPAGGATRDLSRRMFAGGRVRQLAPLLVGRRAERRARIVKREAKTGRTGRLLLVTVSYTVHQDGRVAVEEEQDLIYLGRSSPPALPIGSHHAPAPSGGWREDVLLDHVALFRFSAVTFNAHRIHYDADYAQQVEGYPRLVVHGPLVALLLAGSAHARLRRELVALDFRATAPLFEGLAFSLVGEEQAGQARLSAVRNDGEVAMRATAR